MQKTQSPILASFDLGTTSARVILFDRFGQPLAVAQEPLKQFFPRDGWVEQDAAEIVEKQLLCFRRVLADLRLSLSDIAGIGVTNQRETTIVWDKRTGCAIYPAIVWQDRRTAAECEHLHGLGFEPYVRERTGLRLDPYFSASKIRWILDHVEGARDAAETGHLLFGTVDSWLIWNLTAGKRHITDITNASRTLLFNIHTRQWDDDLLDLFKIPRSMLAEVVPSSGCFAQTELNEGESIPICGIAGDQQSATFGQGCFHEGMTKNTYGTGGFLLMNTGFSAKLSKNRLLTTVGWEINKSVTYALEGSVFIAGAVVNWLRDGLGLFSTASEIETLASSVTDNGGVYLVPAFVGLGAPHWDSHARGMIIGLTRASNRAHIARAALESIAYQCNEVLHAMAADAESKLKELRVDGGAAQNDLLMQFQADISNVPVVRPQVTETTALGAAFLAGLGCGVWQSTNELESLWRSDRIFEPRMSADEREFLTEQWMRAVARTKGWEE